jgi:hypothetical protein
VKKLASFLAMSLLSSAALATTVVPMSIERLTDASTHVIVGVAGESHSQWNPQHTQIITYTNFRVTRALKGAAPATIVVKQLGGSADGYQQKVAGVRSLKPGEQAVLFVHPSQANDGTVVITGLMQGNFSIVASQTGEATVTNGVAGVEQFSTKTVGHFAGAHMRLSQLESMVRAAAMRSAK